MLISYNLLLEFTHKTINNYWRRANMKENKLKNAMRFYLLATQLKYKIRSGWDEKHWNVSKERIESIAEHVYGTCILAISLDSD